MRSTGGNSMGTRVTRAAPHLALEEIKQRMKREPRFWVRQRWWIIYHALLAPRTAKEIAWQTGVSVRTVRRVIASYNREGEGSIQTPGTGGRWHAHLTLEQECTFLHPFFARAEQGKIATVTQIQQAKDRRSRSSCPQEGYLSAAGSSWLAQAGASSPPSQSRSRGTSRLSEATSLPWCKQFLPLVILLIGGPCCLWRRHEGRFGRISVPRRAWAPPGVRPRSPRQIVREFTYVYAAVAPKEGKMISLILPWTDTAVMNVFLSHVASAFSNSFIVMQVDQAGWHQGSLLQIPENIRLIPQPAYSPELNPVEHVWEELREKQFANSVSDSLQELIDQRGFGLTQLESDPKRLRSMTYFPHFRKAEKALLWDEGTSSAAA